MLPQFFLTGPPSTSPDLRQPPPAPLPCAPQPIAQAYWGANGQRPLGCEKAKLSTTYFQLADEIAQVRAC